MNNPTATRRTGKPLSAVAVTGSWLTLPTTPDMHATVAITDAKQSKFYEFSAHIDSRTGEVMGYRFQPAEGDAYDLDPVASVYGWSCSCKDGIYRPNRPQGCRHIQATIQLLATLDDEMAHAEQARLDAEQLADTEFSMPTDAEIDAMAAEFAEEWECGSGQAFAGEVESIHAQQCCGA